MAGKKVWNTDYIIVVITRSVSWMHLTAGVLRFVQKIYLVDIRLFVWSKFHFFCGIAVPRICIMQTTAFSCYRFHYIYMHAWCVSCNKGRHNAAWLCESVIVAFISLWKFLAYMLNVTQRFVMRIISYANIVYFIFI